jgi:hypothetical protein
VNVKLTDGFFDQRQQVENVLNGFAHVISVLA